MKKLKGKEYLFFGSMLFGLFFGAGNLIFPIHLGQLSGPLVLKATIGFILTAVGLPLLGVIAMGLSGKDSLFELSLNVGPKFAYFITILLFLTIGPLFALPRLGTTAFEVGFSNYLSDDTYQIVLIIFTVFFYFIAWLMARNPSKIMDYVGKVLNPIFLLLIGILLVLSWIRPMGDVSEMQVLGDIYRETPVISGFLAGYETLDACASLVFGTIIIINLKRLEIESKNEIVYSIGISGLIMAFLMIVIYASLSFMGAKSLGILELSSNGGVALGQISRYYLGRWGFVVLALTITVACLKTAVGLITSFGQTLITLFPKRSYNFFINLATIISALIATLGLTEIINWSLPVLFFIYPLSIVLILVPFLEWFIGERKELYRWATYFTLPFAFLDGLRVAPEIVQNSKIAQMLIGFGERFIPFYKYGLGWVIFAIIGIVLGFISSKMKE